MTTETPAPPAPPPSLETDDSPAAVYRARRERFGVDRDAIMRRWERVANLRLGAFVLSVPLIMIGLWQTSLLIVAAGGVFLGVFVSLVIYQSGLKAKRQRAAELYRINDEGLSRLARDWDALPMRHAATSPGSGVRGPESTAAPDSGLRTPGIRMLATSTSWAAPR